MKPIIKKLWMLIAMLWISIYASAYDFEVDGIAYTITSLTDLTVRVDQLVDANVTKIIIPERVEYKNKSLTVTEIANEAFKANTAITEVSLPNTVVSIGAEAFGENTSLTTINMPSNLSSIGNKAFYGCSSLTSISIPDGVKEIGYSTFSGCKSLTNIKLSPDTKSIGDRAFQESGFQTIDIPNGVTYLGRYVFLGTPLMEINLPDGIRIIPEGCFFNCKKLRNVTLNSRKIADYAFIGCTALQHIRLPECLESIGDRAFSGCSALIELTIPDSVNSIRYTSFYGCNFSKIEFGSALDGLPLPYYHTYRTGEFSSSFFNDFAYGKSPNVSEYYDIDTIFHKNLKEVIIHNSDNPFAMRGYYRKSSFYPSFTSYSLDYMYIGRPLCEVDSFIVPEIIYAYFGNNRPKGHIRTLEIAGNCTEVPYFYQKIDTLKLGPNINEFNTKTIYMDDIAKIECQSLTPPTCMNGNFPTKVYTDAVLCVPRGCKEAYANAEVWKNFWNIEEIDESAAIDNVLAKDLCISIEVNNGNITISGCPNDVLTEIFDIRGQLVRRTRDKVIGLKTKGFYIVKIGTYTKKIFL